MNDNLYNKKEFDEWFRKLCHVDYPCFFRDILRAKKDDLWEEYKRQADKYNEVNK